jgi:hypothetical protein
MADLQTTNRVKTSKVREVTFGVIPSNPVFKTLRTTSSNLSASPQTVVTEEIRSDRQVADLVLVGQQAQGDIAAELSFRSHDDDLEEALQSTWQNNPYIEVLTEDTEISAVSTTTLTVASALGSPFLAGMLALLEGFETAGNNKLARVSSSTTTSIVFPSSTFAAESNPIPVGAKLRVVGFEGASGDIAATVTNGNALTSSSLDFTTLGIVPGNWLKIGSPVTDTSFVDTDNNGWVRVSAVAANRLSFDIVPTGWGADAGTSKTIRVFMGDYIANGSTKRSNTFERQYLDHSPVSYEYLRGMTLSSLALQFDSQAIIKSTKNYMGRDGLIETSRVAGATDVAATTYDVLNSSSNMGDLSFDGAIVTGPNFITSATIDINNNLRQQNAIGSIGAVGIGNGEFTVTGNLNTYFGTPAVFQKVLNNSRASLSLRCGRSDGNREAMLFDMPTIKLATGAPAVQGKNQDVMMNGTYQAIMDADLGYTIKVQRFWYLPA